MTAIRRFKCNTHMTLPSGLTPVDGQPNMRFLPGQTFDVDAAKCETQQRFIAGRVRAGDLEEVSGTPEPTPEVTVTAAPIAPDPLPVQVAVAPSPDHTPITADSPPPKGTDPAFTFTAKLPTKEG